MTETSTSTSTFTDRHGRVWDCSFNMGAARRIDNSDFTAVHPEKFSILKPDKRIFTEIITNDPLFCAVLWAMVHPQAEKLLGLSPKEDPEAAEAEFCDGLDGRTKWDAKEVFAAQVADFFPEYKTVLLLSLEQMKRLREVVSEELAKVPPEVEEAMRQEIREGIQELKDDLAKKLAESKAERLRKPPVEQKVMATEPFPSGKNIGPKSGKL